MAGTLTKRSNDIEMAVSNRLRKLREERGLTRREVALRIGVTESTIVRWEALERRIPDERKLQLAEMLDVTPSQLRGWE
jgi:transcriptional regulator with XRE-family HTH domain